jgi:hypothetical protein
MDALESRVATLEQENRGLRRGADPGACNSGPGGEAAGAPLREQR